MKTEGTQLIHSFNHTPDTMGNFDGLTKREEFARSAMIGLGHQLKMMNMKIMHE